MLVRQHIHIAGPKRSGKNQVAKRLVPLLVAEGMNPCVIDVDEVKSKLFGKTSFLPDSPGSKTHQAQTLEQIFADLTPGVWNMAFTPIVCATHSARQTFESACELSDRLGSDMKFLLLDPISLEEAIARSATMEPDDYSDMRDFTDPAIVESFLQSARNCTRTYAGISDPRIHRIAQSDPDTMARDAFDFIMA